VCDPDATLRHQVAHVTKTEYVSDVPPHGLTDKKMVEMAAFEEGRRCRMAGVLKHQMRRRKYTKIPVLIYLRAYYFRFE
jgi:hypothetical protein